MSRELAQAAWDAVKDANDPVFVRCVAEHQQNLTARAAGVVRSGLVLDEATAGVYGRFEAKVRELIAPPVEVAPEVAEEAAPEAPAADEAPEVAEEPADLSKLTRAALDELAVAKGLDPKEFATKADVIAALEA